MNRIPQPEPEPEEDDDFNLVADALIQRLVARLNKAINDEEPFDRMKIAGSLAQGFGRLLVTPVPALEQLLHKLTIEFDRAEVLMQELLKDPKAKDLAATKFFASALASKRKEITGCLKAFLVVRPQIEEIVYQETGLRICPDATPIRDKDSI